MTNNDITRGGRTPRMDAADALGGVTSGWDASTPDQILGNLETWKTRAQNEKGFLGGPRPSTVSQKPAPVGQTRRGSLLESLFNILVGYSINFTANLLIFPLFGWDISTRENLTLGVIYTGISLVRSYGLRRLFNWRAVRK